MNYYSNLHPGHLIMNLGTSLPSTATKTSAVDRYKRALVSVVNAETIENKFKLKMLVDTALELRKSNDLSDEDFSELLSWVLTQYVEMQVVAKVDAKLNAMLFKDFSKV